ncbi:MAG: hypothetical protein PPP55_11560 [Halorubrum sp.]
MTAPTDDLSRPRVRGYAVTVSERSITAPSTRAETLRQQASVGNWMGVGTVIGSYTAGSPP